MAYRIKIASTAIADARDYAAFIRDEQQSPKAAIIWLEGLHSQIAGLVHHPNRYAVIPEADELGFPYRAFMYHSHRVVYAVHEKEKRVIVHRIYHGARMFLKSDDVK